MHKLVGTSLVNAPQIPPPSWESMALMVCVGILINTSRRKKRAKRIRRLLRIAEQLESNANVFEFRSSHRPEDVLAAKLQSVGFLKPLGEMLRREYAEEYATDV